MNNEERELLELAAKAAGIKIIYWNDGKEPYSSGQGFILESGKLWNPFTDGGDAFRLAVHLGLSIDFAEWVNTVCYGVDEFVQEEWKDKSSLDATRLAIVRAAAELGKAMP